MALFRLRQWGVAWLLALAVGLAVSAPVKTPVDAPVKVRVGVLAFQGAAHAQRQWSATMAHLTQSVEGTVFELQPLSYEQLNHAVKSDALDFVLTNPEHYVSLRNAFGLRPMVTVAAMVGDQVRDDFGSTVFTLTSTDIHTLADVRNRRVAAVDVYSLGGFLMAADAFRAVDIDLRSRDVRDLRFLGLPHSQVVEDVLAGRSEVGIVRSGVLEQMAQQGGLDLSAVRVLDDRLSPAFPHHVSTELYPEWPMSAMAHTPGKLAKAVTMALLAVGPQSEPARAARIHGFYPPANYTPVESLMQRLRVYPRVVSMPLWTELNIEYGTELRLFGGALLLAGLGLSGYLWVSNRRLTRVTRLYRQAQEGLQVTAAAFNSQVGLLVTDPHTRIIRANRALCDMLGVDEAQLVGQTTASLRGGRVPAGIVGQLWAHLKRQGSWRGELLCRHRLGHDVPCIVTITSVGGAGAQGVSGFVGSFVDVTRLKQTEDEIRQLAFYDVLTALPNRRLFLERLQADLTQAVDSGALGAVMFIDLDHFKTLNDAHGHTAGDQLLRHIADRLGRVVGPGDLVARLGGDEFVVMLPGLAGPDAQAMAAALARAEAVRHAILEPLTLDVVQGNGSGQHLAYQCSASIGVALYGATPESLTEVLKRADVAMYQAKQDGRNAIRQYDAQAQGVLNRKAAMTADLSSALAQHQFELHYQVQCNKAGAPVGAECLLRWHHPVRGAVAPVEFIGLAEESGAIVAMGNWVLSTACHTLAQWALRPGFEHLTLSVNVSPRQFNESDFVARIQATLADTGAQPDKLVLEITEGIVLGHADETIQKMHQLRAMGITFSIDDFGTGYSSLSYLQRLPLREVKIDKAFVRDVTHDPNSAAIVRAIIALGESLQLEVVSEGVETEAQKAMLQTLGCDVLQGYLLGRPVARAAFEASMAPSAELV